MALAENPHARLKWRCPVVCATTCGILRASTEEVEPVLRRSQRVSHPLSLILIDVDYFKAFNDTSGHLEGDACLQRLSRVVEKAINRPGDLVSRYGGEEFAVILSNTNTDTAFNIAEAIRCGVEAMEVPHTGSELSGLGTLTISAGVATATPTPESLPADIIHRADLALYQAKRDGRNRVVVHGD